MLANWGKLKAAEHAEEGDGAPRARGVPASCRRSCARSASARKRRRSASTGPTPPVREKIDEELREIDGAVAGKDPQEMEHEVGDLLLAVSRYAAKLGVAPEDALRSAIGRFTTRFELVEDQVLATGKQVKEVPLAELDRMWEIAKAQLMRVPKK